MNLRNKILTKIAGRVYPVTHKKAIVDDNGEIPETFNDTKLFNDASVGHFRKPNQQESDISTELVWQYNDNIIPYDNKICTQYATTAIDDYEPKMVQRIPIMFFVNRYSSDVSYRVFRNNIEGTIDHIIITNKCTNSKIYGCCIDSLLYINNCIVLGDYVNSERIIVGSDNFMTPKSNA